MTDEQKVKHTVYSEFKWFKLVEQSPSLSDNWKKVFSVWFLGLLSFLLCLILVND